MSIAMMQSARPSQLVTQVAALAEAGAEEAVVIDLRRLPRSYRTLPLQNLQGISTAPEKESQTAPESQETCSTSVDFLQSRARPQTENTRNSARNGVLNTRRSSGCRRD